MKYYWINKRISPDARGFVITNKVPLGVARNKLKAEEVIRAIFYWSQKRPDCRITTEFK